MKGSGSIARALVFRSSGLKLVLLNAVSGLGVKKVSVARDGGDREVVVASRLSRVTMALAEDCGEGRGCVTVCFEYNWPFKVAEQAMDQRQERQ